MVHASVIICTYNRAARLQETLASLAAVQGPEGVPWEVVIVDNNSTDATSGALQRAQSGFPVPLVLVREPRQGKSFALNRGIRTARGELLLFTDDDVDFDPQWLGELVRPFDVPEVMGVGGRIEARWTTTPPAWWVSHGPYGLPAAIVQFDLGREALELTTAPFGANMAFRRRVFEELGMFREDIGPHAGTLMRGEDVEIGMRVLAAGGRLAYAPDSVVRHPVEPERVSKRYFRRWCYDGGRSLARSAGVPNGTPTWFGAPRYLFRQLLEGAAFALSLAWSPRGFFWELRAWSAVGAIREHRRKVRAAAAGLDSSEPSR